MSHGINGVEITPRTTAGLAALGVLAAHADLAVAAGTSAVAISGDGRDASPP
jgi:hypothetical protein